MKEIKKEQAQMNRGAVDAKMSDDWAYAYDFSKQDSKAISSCPAENLVRLFKGEYITGKRLDTIGKSVLDVGFGDGTNMKFLASLGLQIFGIEIHQKICDEVAREFQKANVSAELKVGMNQQIPYADNKFDFLVSWNVLHYEGSEEGIKAGLKEYARVLKPNGHLILSTTGPTDKILLNAHTLGHHCYEIRRPNDFRQGQVHFFFDSSNYIEWYFSPHFKNLQIGRTENFLFKEKLDWWLVTGQKN